MNTDAIPVELRARPQWVLWRLERRDEKQTKVPYQAAAPTLRASTTDPATWATFEDALAASVQADGVGYVFSPDDPFAGADLDHCFDDGVLHADAGAIVFALNSYTERSVSGVGLHVLIRADLNGSRNRTAKTGWGGSFECYGHGRFFCITGDHLTGTPATVEARQRELDEVLAFIFPAESKKAPVGPAAPLDIDDETLVEKARRARTGADFRRLYDNGDTGGYDSQSEADLRLCGMLAFWTQGDRSRIDGLFRRSGLMRDKWDSRRGETTYGAQTIEAALGAQTASYDPPRTPTASRALGLADAEPADPFALTTVTARDLCAKPDPDRSGELLGPLIVERNRIIIGAHTGEGKTTLALRILAAIGDSLELLGYQGTGDAGALMLDAEQSERSLKRRLRETGLDQAGWLDTIRVPDGLQLDADPRHVAELDRVLRSGGYKVVCADPFYKLHAGDSNAEREAVDLMRRFDAWRDELGFAFLLPLHCRKPVPGMRFSIHDLFGSSAYVRGAEVVLGLQRIRDGYSRLHFLKDRDGDLPIGTAWGLLFDRENGYRRDPDDGAHKPITLEQVRELLQQTPGMTKTQLVKATGKKPRTVEGVLRELGAVATKLNSDGKGHGDNAYSLPDSDPNSQPTRSQLALEDET